MLELIGAARDGASVTDLAAESGLDKGTVSRLLSTIRAAGWAAQSPVDRRYRLAGKALLLSHDNTNHVNVRVLARTQLTQLQARWNETVNLGIVEGHSVVYIEVLYSTAALCVRSVIGQRMPLTTTALGQAFLSRIADDELNEFVSLMPEAPKTLVKRKRLLAELKLCRDRGYAIDDGLNEPEVLCVGAAVVDVSSTPVATLSVTGPAYRMRPRIGEIGASCVAAARAVSVALGAPDQKGAK